MGVDLVDRNPDVCLRFAHHRRRRDARVDVVRLDGLYLRPRVDRTKRNNAIVCGSRNADGVVFQNAFCRKTYEMVLGFTPERSADIVNGADPAEFAPRRPGNVLLANAQWRHYKRLDAIVGAFAKLTERGVDARLHITGEPEARVNHPGITYLGNVSSEVVRSELAVAAASIHLSWLDWCPNAMVEAVVAGCPVIYTNSGGHPYIGRDAGTAIEDGQWDFKLIDEPDAPPIDLDAVADAMQQHLEHPSTVYRPELDIRRVASAYVDFFDELLAEAKPRRWFAWFGRPERPQSQPQSRPVADTGSDKPPTVHCHDELLQDLADHTFIDDATMMRWAADGYATSRHLLTLYAMARGIEAKQIIEIGFGRSTFVLARAAAENAGTFATCDMRDFSYLFSVEEKQVTRFHHGASDTFWPTVAPGVGFAFFDYFSDKRMSVSFIVDEIDRCLSLMLQDGLIAIHDTIVSHYRLHKAMRVLAKRSDLEVLSLPYASGLGLIRYCGRSSAGHIHPTARKKPESA
jgi:hypothetical protein